MPVRVDDLDQPRRALICLPDFCSFIAVENIDSYCVIISSKAVYFLKSGDYVDREAIFLEVKYDDLYHCLISKDHGKVYVQLTKKAVNSSSGVSMPGPSHQKPKVRGGLNLAGRVEVVSKSVLPLISKGPGREISSLQALNLPMMVFFLFTAPPPPRFCVAFQEHLVDNFSLMLGRGVCVSS